MVILDEDDKWTEDPEDVKRMLCDYIEILFTSTNRSQNQMKLCYKYVVQSDKWDE